MGKENHRYNKANGKLGWHYWAGSVEVESNSINDLKDFVCDIADKKVNFKVIPKECILNYKSVKITGRKKSYLKEFVNEINAFNSGESIELCGWMTDFIYDVESDYQSFYELHHNNFDKVHGEITRQVLVDAVIEDLKEGFAHGDYTVLDELLFMLPTKNLIQALPEERWKQFDKLKKDYFEIVKQGFNEELQREEIQVHCGENGNLFLIKTEEGFVVDVYNQDENVNTMTVWEDDLTPNEE